MGATRHLVVRSVESQSDWRTFFGLPDEIYRDDPCYVRPLEMMRRGQLDVQRNPFYLHAERAAFLCWEGKKPVGRIVAIVDRLHQQHYQDRMGFFGFFEAYNDPAIAATLTEAAAAWLVARGCDAIRGPVNPSMKSDFGVLVEGHQFPPYALMAHSRNYYHELLTACGFAVARTFLAFALHEEDTREGFQDGWKSYDVLCRRIRDRYPQIRIRHGDANHVERDIRRINELGDQVRSVGWGFVPFTPEELDHAVRQLRRILKPGMMYLAEVGDEVVGYIMLIPDLNWALQHTFGTWDWLRMIQLPRLIARCQRTRILGLGVAPKYRASGLAGLLIRQVFDDWGERYRAWELSWVDSENIRSIRACTGFLPVQQYKQYHLYQRPLL